MKEGVTRVAALRTGEVDFANWIPSEYLERLTKEPQLQVLRGRDAQRAQCYFNLRKPAFQDVRVRQALLGYGIDRHAIARTALLGFAQPLWSFVPPGARGHFDSATGSPMIPRRPKPCSRRPGMMRRIPCATP